MSRHHEVLGVRVDAGPEEVKRAYRARARVLHPDAGGSSEEFVALSAAYHALSVRSSSRPRREAATHAPRPGRRRPVDGEDLVGDLRLSASEALLGCVRTVRSEGRDVEVVVPPESVEGTQLRVAGGGVLGVDGGRDGDLLLLLHADVRGAYRVEGLDVITELEVGPSKLLLGGGVPLTLVDGGEVELWVPARSWGGRRVRVAGRGLQGVGQRGDQVVELRVRVPSQLSAQQVALLEELGRTGL